MSRRRSKTGTPLTEQARAKITSVLEVWRRRLEKESARAIATVPSIHESFDYEDDQPDLGRLCALVGELMKAIAGKLVVAEVLLTRPEPLAKAIETERRRLFQTQAVLRAMTHFLRSTPDFQAPQLLLLFDSFHETCESALAALDPAGSLGLPAPDPD